MSSSARRGCAGVEKTVDDGLDLPVALWRDDGGPAPGFRVGEDGIGVALVAQERLGRGARRGHPRGVTPDVRALAAGQDDGDGQAQAVGSRMDLGREATARSKAIASPATAGPGVPARPAGTSCTSALVPTRPAPTARLSASSRHPRGNGSTPHRTNAPPPSAHGPTATTPPDLTPASRASHHGSV